MPVTSANSFALVVSQRPLEARATRPTVVLRPAGIEARSNPDDDFGARGARAAATGSRGSAEAAASTRMADGPRPRVLVIGSCGAGLVGPDKAATSLATDHQLVNIDARAVIEGNV